MKKIAIELNQVFLYNTEPFTLTELHNIPSVDGGVVYEAVNVYGMPAFFHATDEAHMCFLKLDAPRPGFLRATWCSFVSGEMEASTEFQESKWKKMFKMYDITRDRLHSGHDIYDHVVGYVGE